MNTTPGYRRSRRTPRELGWTPRSEASYNWHDDSWALKGSHPSESMGEPESDQELKVAKGPLQIPEGCQTLVNWDGNWAPAPVEWHLRPWFEKPVEQMENWLDDTFHTLYDLQTPMPMSYDLEQDGELVKTIFSTNICLDGLTVEGFKNPNMAVSFYGDIVPRYWIPENLEHNLNASTYWEYFKDSPPTAFDHSDQNNLLTGNTRPWWKCYPSNTAFFMAPMISQPEDTIGPNLTEERQQFTKRRLETKCSSHAMEEHNNRIRAQAKARAKRSAAARKASVLETHPALDPKLPDVIAEAFEPAPDTSIKPTIDLEVRKAKEHDVLALCEIYNHYVENSCVVPDAKPVSKNAMLNRLRTIQSVKLPFLVATRQRTNKVVGFIQVDDFNDERGLYRFTAEVEVYVRPGFERKRIAKVLMDQVLAILDPNCLQHCALNVDLKSEFWLETQRRIKSLVVHLPFPRRHKPKWLFEWLCGLGWQEKGLLEEVGYKDGSIIDLAILQRMTGERIDKNLPPVCNY